MFDKLFKNLKSYFEEEARKRNLRAQSLKELEIEIKRQQDAFRAEMDRRSILYRQDWAVQNKDFVDFLELQSDVRIWHDAINTVQTFMKFVKEFKDGSHQLIQSQLDYLVLRKLIPDIYHTIQLTTPEGTPFLFFIKFDENKVMQGEAGIMTEEKLFEEYNIFVQTAETILETTEKGKGLTQESKLKKYEAWSSYGRSIVEVVQSEEFDLKNPSYFHFVINSLTKLSLFHALHFDGVEINGEVFLFKQRSDDQPANIITFEEFTRLYDENTRVEI